LRRGPLLVALLFAAATGLSCSGNPAGPTPATPTVAAISPTSGTTLGGTTVTITGTNFAAGAAVTVGGLAATNVTIVSGTSLTAVTPARGAGPADVAVSVGGRSGSLVGGFTYVTPPPNLPPVIQTIVARGARPNQPVQFADLNEAITVTATVTDAETAPANLTYEWAAPFGTFSGTGAAVTWRAPQQFPTPGTIVLTLTVVDGLHRITGTTTIRIHDSVGEVGDMARGFLLLFSDSSVAPEVVVQNFLSGCGVDGRGRENELEDVIRNRQQFTITSSPQSSVGQPQVTVSFGGTCPFRARRGDACAQVAVRWTSIEKATGQISTVAGTDQVTAIYNGTRWGLCDSDFDGRVVTLTGETKPGSFFKQ
jgi:hypothetical protein